MMMVSTEQVWRDFSGELRKFFLRRVEDPQLADDLLQETFLKVHRGIRTLKDTERLAPWLYRTARNTLIDHFRRAVPEQQKETEPAVSGPPSQNRNEEMAACVAGMIAVLPDKYRRAVELVEIEGLPQTEAARKLGLSVSGAKSRVQRGRRQLKSMFLKCCEIELDRRGNVLDYQQQLSQSGCGAGPTC